MFQNNFTHDQLVQMHPLFATARGPFSSTDLSTVDVTQRKSKLQQVVISALRVILDSGVCHQMAAYVILGALAVVSPHVRERYMGSMQHEFDLPGVGGGVALGDFIIEDDDYSDGEDSEGHDHGEDESL